MVEFFSSTLLWLIAVVWMAFGLIVGGAAALGSEEWRYRLLPAVRVSFGLIVMILIAQLAVSFSVVPRIILTPVEIEKADAAKLVLVRTLSTPVILALGVVFHLLSLAGVYAQERQWAMVASGGILLYPAVALISGMVTVWETLTEVSRLKGEAGEVSEESAAEFQVQIQDALDFVWQSFSLALLVAAFIILTIQVVDWILQRNSVY